MQKLVTCENYSDLGQSASAYFDVLVQLIFSGQLSERRT